MFQSGGKKTLTDGLRSEADSTMYFFFLDCLVFVRHTMDFNIPLQASSDSSASQRCFFVVVVIVFLISSQKILLVITFIHNVYGSCSEKSNISFLDKGTSGLRKCHAINFNKY